MAQALVPIRCLIADSVGQGQSSMVSASTNHEIGGKLLFKTRMRKNAAQPRTIKGSSRGGGTNGPS